MDKNPDNKKTGLGGSLLLQRTDRPPRPVEPEHPETPDAETSETPEAPDAPNVSDPTPADSPQRPPRQTATNDKPQRQVPRDRCTLYIDRDVNGWLDLAARAEGRERSEVASDLLRMHLPKYRIERAG